MSFIDLDDLNALRARDPQGMLGFVDRLADVARPAFDRGAAFRSPIARPGRVLVAGMGGSAISGDLARTLFALSWEVPISVCRQPALPRWVSRDDLVIFLSYSGETAETLSCFDQARSAKIPMAAVTVGGTLGTLAGDAGLPVLPLAPGWQPRAALGELYFTLLGMLSAIGAPVEPTDAIAGLAAHRDTYGGSASGAPGAPNVAKRIAWTLADWLGKPVATPVLPPAVFGVMPSTEAVALRWKCQFNENSKATVLHACFPELTHNEIVNLASAGANLGPIVVLRDPSDPPMIRRQVDHVIEMLAGTVYDLQSDGDDLLSRQMALVQLGDYVSVYLALLRGIDPLPVDPIVDLKRRMAGQQGAARPVRAATGSAT
jgi:glucose/mannose-6-phosphate isomerase